jgi:hypothetical protein
MDEFIGCYIQFGEGANSFQLREGYALPLLDSLNDSINNIRDNVLSKQEEAGDDILDYSRAISLFYDISNLYKTSLWMSYQVALDMQAESEMQAGGATKVKKSKSKKRSKKSKSKKRSKKKRSKKR